MFNKSIDNNCVGHNTNEDIRTVIVRVIRCEWELISNPSTPDTFKSNDEIRGNVRNRVSGQW